MLYATKMLAALLIFSFIVLALFAPFLFLLLRHKYSSRRPRSSKTVVGVFHPYCNAGGGGEKVLWVALEALSKKYPEAEFYVYTGDVEANPGDILKKVRSVLNVDLKGDVKFVYLTRRRWIEGGTYPYFTLLGQSLGSIYLGFEALSRLNPGVRVC